MKNVLYIGNALSSKGKTTTVIETLAAHLSLFCDVSIASKKTNKFLRLFEMIKLVVSNRSTADYVLIDTYSTTNFFYAIIISNLCKWFNLKYIPILHGGNLESRLKNNPKLSAKIFKNAHRLISPSIFLKTTFTNYGYNNIEYIPNTIEIKNYEFISREIHIIKLIWVRSFSKIYNPTLAVLVLEALLENGFKAELTMVGPDVDGSLNKVKELAKTKDLEINFTGKLSKEQWLEISKSHNLFINTTDFDNMPVSVIEAMALGLPIVSTNVGGLPYLILDNVEGVLVPPNDIDAMVEAIIKLKKDSNLREKLVVNARNKSEQFDWKAVKPKWETLLS